jgi:hypothetical protein
MKEAHLDAPSVREFLSKDEADSNPGYRNGNSPSICR